MIPCGCGHNFVMTIILPCYILSPTEKPTVVSWRLSWSQNGIMTPGAEEVWDYQAGLEFNSQWWRLQFCDDNAFLLQMYFWYFLAGVKFSDLYVYFFHLILLQAYVYSTFNWEFQLTVNNCTLRSNNSYLLYCKKTS